MATKEYTLLKISQIRKKAKEERKPQKKSKEQRYKERKERTKESKEWLEGQSTEGIQKWINK